MVPSSYRSWKLRMAPRQCTNPCGGVHKICIRFCYGKEHRLEQSSSKSMTIPKRQQLGARDESQTALLTNGKIKNHSISQHDMHTQEDLSHCASCTVHRRFQFIFVPGFATLKVAVDYKPDRWRIMLQINRCLHPSNANPTYPYIKSVCIPI